MNLPIPIPTLVFLFCVTVVAVLVTRETARRRASKLRALRAAAWARPRAREWPLDGKALARYHQRNGTPPESIDDGTWRDLGMDAVFDFLDRTYTFAGAARLYDRIRTQLCTPLLLQRFDALVDAFRDESVREGVEAIVQRLGAQGYSSDVLLFLVGQSPKPPEYRWVFPATGLTMVTCCALGVVTKWALVFAFGLSIVGLAVRLFLHHHLVETIRSFRALEGLFAAGEALTSLPSANPVVREALGEVRIRMGALAGLRRATSWLGIDGPRSSEVTGVVIAYVNWLFFLDLTAASFALSFVGKHKAALQALFEQVGELDAALAVASVRDGAANTTKPEIREDAEQLLLDGVTHPLVANPVPNSIAVDERGVLVTGANMCGKSTFLRAVAINAILAQTLNMVFARTYRAPPVLVRTVMSAIDDVQRNRSYYYAELEAAKALLEPSLIVERRILLVDELFRGTNTNERIAAGKALLEALVAAGNFVFAATHDLELVELLAETFDPYHFGENVTTGGWDFSYKVVPGPSTTRNAIALLELVGFPRDLVADARRVAAVLDRQRPVADTSSPLPTVETVARVSSRS